MSAKGTIFIVDANVLIDYLEIDASVLAMISAHLGPIRIPRRVFEEVKKQRLKDTDCEALGLTIVTEETSDLTAAAAAVAVKRGSLSFQDHLVLILARNQGWVAITNDGSLRKALEADWIAQALGPGDDARAVHGGVDG